MTNLKKVNILHSLEEISLLKRQITGEKRQRIRISHSVKITEEEIESFESIDTRLMKRARQLDKEQPLFKTSYEYMLFGEWKSCKESDLNMIKKSGFQIREIQVPCSRVKELKAKYHIKRW